jgi:hypothetical protein
MKLDDIVAQVLALPAEDRAKILARLQASLSEYGRGVTAVAGVATRAGLVPTRLLDLAGAGRGLWGADSAEYLRRLRDEWH